MDKKLLGYLKSGYRTSAIATNQSLDPYFQSTSNSAPTRATAAIVNGIYELTGNGTDAQPRVTQTDTSLLLVAGNKVAVRVKFKVDNSSVLSVMIQAMGGTTTGTVVTLDTIATPVADTEYTLKGEFTVTNQAGQLRLFIVTTYADAATSNGKKTKLIYSEHVDLTVSYGTSKEPSALYYHGLIEDQQAGKFTGSITLVTPLSEGNIITGSTLDLRLISLEHNAYGDTVVCLGDSITGNYAYPTNLATILSATVSNCGVGGTRMTGGGTNYDKFSMVALADAYSSGVWTDQDAANAVLSLANYTTIKGVDFTKIKYLIILFGTNDFAGLTPMGTDSDNNTYFKGAINYIINKMATAFPHLRLGFVTPPYRSRIDPGDGLDTDTHANSLGLYLKDYVDAIIASANLNHIPVLDLWRNGGINKYNSASWLLDGVHPLTGYGDVLIAEKIGGFIKDLV